MRQPTLDYLDRVCGGLVKAAEMVRADTDEAIKSADHVILIKHYDQVRKATDQIKEAREALSKMEETLSRETVPDFMRKAGVKTTTVEGVGRVTISHRFSCSMLDKERGILWLKEQGHAGMVQETVNSSSLGAFAKEMITGKGKELPGDIFKTSTSPHTSITKA